ncbi:unnamed protein product [Rangifer tarandus platyrhynchus]|uniref:Uncharacterized protein n=1 Tax=Rangifer tarandus platyrhynchus TaxID=3082113 RepID=A0ABN8ZL76_RANTA|nr:unnamed protein product [Rangifer tarandus platyrhynchus]
MPGRGKSVLLPVSLCGYARRGAALTEAAAAAPAASLPPHPPGSPRSRGGRGAGLRGRRASARSQGRAEPITGARVGGGGGWGRRGAPDRAPGAAPRARGIPGSGAPGPGAECSRVCPSVRPPPPPAPCGGSRLAQLGGRARQMRGAWSRPPAPRASRPRRPELGGRDRGELPGRAQHLRKLAEKFENEKSNRLPASALPMTLQPR